jgi:hypothetical protein
MAGLLDDMKAAQAAKARGAMSHRQFDPVTGRQFADAMQAVGLLASPIPVVGDVAGLLGDAAMYAAKPEERTLGNAAWTALGALPFVPSAAGAVNKAVKQAATAPMPQLATRYPTVAPGVVQVDPKTGKSFIGKVLSDEGLQAQKLRQAIQKEMDAKGFAPYFDPAQRSYVNPADYPLSGDSRAVVPKKVATQEKWKEVVDTPEARERLMEAYKRGSQYPGSENWYAMKQLEDEFVKEYGSEVGKKMFRERFGDAMAATTGGADPTSNLLMAHYGNYQRQLGVPIPSAGHEMPFPIGGRYVTGNMELYNKHINEALPIGNETPKRMNFAGNFMGHRDRATVVEQMMGLFRPGGPMSPEKGTYGVYENVITDLAGQLGIPSANFQDVAWAGGKTAKDPKFQPRPMIQVVNEAVERTSRMTGLPPEEVVRRGLVRSEIPLYGVGGLGLLGLTAGGDEEMQ